MRYGPRIDVRVYLQVDLAIWETAHADVWESNGGREFPLASFPSPREDPVFGEHLASAFGAAAGAAGHQVVMDVDPEHGRIRHPLDVRFDVDLGEKTSAKAFDFGRGIAGTKGMASRLEIGVVVAAYNRVVDSYRVAQALGPVSPANTPRLLYGYETVATLNQRLPDTPEDLTAYLDAHSALPREWLHWMTRANITYADGIALLASGPPERAFETLLTMSLPDACRR